MLEMREIQKSYEDVKILNKINLKIKEGRCIAIVGPSGSGKSTLLKSIAGIEYLDGGEIYLSNELINYKDKDYLINFRKNILGIVFQEFLLLKKASVYEQIFFTNEVGDKEIRFILDKLKITKLKDKKIEFCSGGEKQRVAIARALVKKPKIILADEPTANLDAKLAINSFKLMIDLAKEFKAIVLVTSHDDRILPLCDNVYKLENGGLSLLN